MEHVPLLPSAPTPSARPGPFARPTPPHPARWLAFGGGAEPASNQVSMESDLALAADVLGPGGVLLFAGGPESEGVYVLDERPKADERALLLGEILAPRAGRDARYRRTVLTAHGPATREAILATLERELSEPGPPLPVFVDCHGDGGATPIDNSLATWGGHAIGVRDLAAVLDRARRPVRLLVSACFSGGLGELAFAEARPEAGATTADRCGVFASTWDLEATGCDPDPDRRSHEGYAVHVLHALRGEDRDGHRVAVDLDRDGAISMLEAHAFARVASQGLDVPTTTSERWLRHAAPKEGPRRPLAEELREDEATIAALSAKLGLPTERDRAEELARHTFDELERRFDERAAREDAANAAFEDARRAVKGELLARFPALDDPWHPDFARTFGEAHRMLGEILDRSPAYRRYLEARKTADDAADASLDVALERAPYERLLRALDDVQLAGRLKHRGGTGWARYLEFLACERSTLR